MVKKMPLRKVLLLYIFLFFSLFFTDRSASKEGGCGRFPKKLESCGR